MTNELVEAKDDRDILDILKAELDFLEKGGYGRSVRTPWLPTSLFQDSPTCFCYPSHEHGDPCLLMRFVPSNCRPEAVPCHHIPLNEAGETVEHLERTGSQEETEELVKSWLRATIAEIEQERASEEVVKTWLRETIAQSEQERTTEVATR